MLLSARMWLKINKDKAAKIRLCSNMLPQNVAVSNGCHKHQTRAGNDSLATKLFVADPQMTHLLCCVCLFTRHTERTQFLSLYKWIFLNIIL